MRAIMVVVRRELASYFASPSAYVFLLFYLTLSSGLTFFLGDFFARGQADLAQFFWFQPWIAALFAPAVAMGSWAYERKSGNIELLFSLPLSVSDLVIAKFLAVLLFAAVALALTFPMVLVLNYLGQPDNLTIFAGYMGCFAIMASFLAISCCISALCKNQVVAFVLAFSTVIALNILSFMPQPYSDFGIVARFESITRGLVPLSSLVYYASLTLCGIFANAVLIDLKKAD